MIIIVREPGTRSIRVIASGRVNAVAGFMTTQIGQAYLLRRVAVFANHETLVLQ